MLIPRNRLLACVAFVAFPLAVAAGWWPALTGTAATFAGLIVAAALIDAAPAWKPARGLLQFRFPELVRLTKGRAGILEFVVTSAAPVSSPRAFRVGLTLPPEIATDAEEMDAALAPGVASTLFQWPCRPLERGNFALPNVYYMEDSPLGLWTVRRVQPIECQLRVYPDLRIESRRAAAAFLTRRNSGSHSQRQVGRGREFEKLREYVPGDSSEDISWKATARRQKPISKVFQIERTQEVYLIVDASRLSGRSVTADAPEVTVLERYVSSALLLCVTAQRQGDLFGLVTFDAGVRTFLRARTGGAHFNACREAIGTLEPARVSPDFDELVTFLRLRLRRRALLIFLTSLDDPVQAESCARALDKLARHHVVVVGALTPSGVAPLFSDIDLGAGVQTTEHVYQRLAGHLQWQHLRERELLLRKHGVRVALLDPARLTEQLIAQYLSVKRRQLI